MRHDGDCFRAPDQGETVTCLLGDPVSHSVSHIMFGAFADQAGIGTYTHLRIKLDSHDPRSLKDALRAIVDLGFRGANVTLPFKELALEQMDDLATSAVRVGAVNTIVNDDGKLIGHNTDKVGAYHAIDRHLIQVPRIKRVVLAGAGGAARAIVGCFAPSTTVTLLTTTHDGEKVAKLKADFADRVLVKSMSLTDVRVIDEIARSQLLVNATPVGMYPNSNSQILSSSTLAEIAERNPGLAVFDVVFNPHTTQFLKTAESHGLRTCAGLYMMLYQGLPAFEMWTGHILDRRIVSDIYPLLAMQLEQ